MKTNEIDIGGIYVAKVTGKLAKVRIERENVHGGWDATNLETNRRVRIKSARRLRQEVDDRCDETGANPKEASHDHDGDCDGDGRCSTRHCQGKPVLDYLGKPLCQECWQRQADEAEASDATGAATPPTPIAPSDSTATPGNEDISTKADSANNTDRRRLSALDAAAAVLTDAPAPMRCGELIATMAARDLWTSPNGKTPQATLNSALIREIRRKANQSRFRHCGRGMFTLNTGCEQAGAASN